MSLDEINCSAAVDDKLNLEWKGLTEKSESTEEKVAE